MKTVGVIAVVVVALGLIAYKSVRSSGTMLAEPSPASTTPTNASASVVLVADPGEAESSCICGQIIRSVRAVRNQGVAVREVDPETSPELAKGYKALVNPTVLVLDESGKEVRRFEGEDKATFAAIRTELERIAKK